MRQRSEAELFPGDSGGSKPPALKHFFCTRQISSWHSHRPPQRAGNDEAGNGSRGSISQRCHYDGVYDAKPWPDAPDAGDAPTRRYD